MDRVEMIKAALDMARISDNKYWPSIDLFEGGVGYVTIPVLEDHKEVFKVRIEIIEPEVEIEVKQESLFGV